MNAAGPDKPARAVEMGLSIWFLMLAALFSAGCASDPSGARAGRGADELLTPLLTLSGALFTPVADPTGLPLPKGNPPVFRPLVNPVSAAANANEVYIMDAGAASIYRYDRSLNIMAPVPGVRADRSARLRIGPDLSLYVLDPPGRRVVQLARSGQPIAAFSDINLARPVDFAIEENGAHVLIADGTYGQILAFHPLGRAAFVIHLRGDERNRIQSLGHFAAGADALYISDPACSCIARVARSGAVLSTFGHHEIAQPGPIAVDRFQRVLVADQLDGSIKVFAGGKHISTFPARTRGVVQVSDLSVTGSTLVIADGPGARVHLIQIKPPPRTP